MDRSTLLSYLANYPQRGEEIAFVHRRGLRTTRWSYARIASAAYATARELERRGICKGERILLHGGNCAEWVAAFWGCLLRGCVVVPLDRESTEDFVRRVHEQTAARLMFTDAAARARSPASIPLLPLAELEAAIAAHSDAPYTGTEIAEDDAVEIIYTSGTTAEPKGVVLTHRNLLANLISLEEEIEKHLVWERLVHPVRFLNLVPLSHVFGQFMSVFVPQLLAGEVHFQDSLNPAEIARSVRRERISVIVLVPRLLDNLREWVERDYAAHGRLEELERRLASPERAGYSYKHSWVCRELLRWWTFRRVHARFGFKFWVFISGGATLDERTETFWRRLGFPVLQGYGMTETASLISVNHPFKMSRGSVGKVMPGYELKVDESGEILLRGASVSPGYWKGEGVEPHAGGWLRTGDIAERDAEGNLFFKGRKKDVIVTGAGLNIHPEDLEAALNRLPEVRRSCVIGIEGAQGPEPLAVLILDADADAEVAINRANADLAPHQRIRRHFVWSGDDFPRTPTQKVIKREVIAKVHAELRSGDSTAATRDASASAGSGAATHARSHAALLAASISSLLRRLNPETPVQLDPAANLTTDLKLDSLGRVELLSALEDHYGVEIDEAAFTQASTLHDVERVLHGELEEQAAPYPYPKWSSRFPVTWIRTLLHHLVITPITLWMSRMTVEGREHLEGIRGPFLFFANHITYADHALILVALPERLRRRLGVAMEGEVLRDWLYPPPGTRWLTRLRWLAEYYLVITFFHVFPLPKRSGFRRAFAYAGERVDAGDSILIFPEGERRPRGVMDMGEFKTGAGLLAKRLDVPVIPVKLEGLYELRRDRVYFPAPGVVKVKFGAPVLFSPGMEPAEIAREMEQLLEG